MNRSHYFEKSDLVSILESIKDRTLGEIDTKGVFEKTKTKSKITGIAGDVIEQSVLGYPPDTRQKPDLDVGGVLTELKTTGMREKFIDGAKRYVAKEPVSVTAVSINTITLEQFNNSNFWHKAEHMLFVFYLYDSKKTVPAAEYKRFFVKGFCFHEFSPEDKLVLQNDWQIIHDFLLDIKLRCSPDQAKKEYPNLSTIINKKTVYLDTAPKYPNSPRFRIRKRVIDVIIKETFENTSFEVLPGTYKGLSDVERKCKELTGMYKNWSMMQLMNCFEIYDSKYDTKIPKQSTEQVIVSMFGGKSKKISNIALFNKFGYICKTISLSSKYKRTEDVKLFPVDFDELVAETVEDENGDIREKRFEDSELYQYLNDNRFLYAVFKENPIDGCKNINRTDNTFLGFKVIDLSDEEIICQAKNMWTKAREIINTGKLKFEPSLYKNGRQRFAPKTGVAMGSPNLPKSEDNLIFFRGTGKDASDKITVFGVSMLKQYYWIRGSYIVEKINNVDEI